MKPNPDADVLKLPQWFLEINNTRVYLKTDINSNEPYFLFEPKEKIYNVMNKAEKIERVLSRVNYKSKMSSISFINKRVTTFYRKDKTTKIIETR